MTVTWGSFITGLSFSIKSDLTSSVVSPATFMSFNRGRVIIPSGLTITGWENTGSCHTEIVSSSSTPTRYPLAGWLGDGLIEGFGLATSFFSSKLSPVPAEYSRGWAPADQEMPRARARTASMRNSKYLDIITSLGVNHQVRLRV